MIENYKVKGFRQEKNGKNKLSREMIEKQKTKQRQGEIFGEISAKKKNKKKPEDNNKLGKFLLKRKNT